jgi:hypothetical protein
MKPQILANHPQYMEAVAIRNRLAEALRLEQALESQYLERLNMLCVAPGQQLDEVERALSMADGQPVPAGSEALSQAIREIRGKQSLLHSGIEQQEHRIATLAAKLSTEYCQERRAEHVKIIEQLRDGLEQVRAAVCAEQELRDSIRFNGYRDTLPGLHQLSFFTDSTEASTLREIDHYLTIHGGKLSESRNVSGIALRNFESFGVSGKVGDQLIVSEVTAELLRYHGMLDPNVKALKQSHVQKIAELILE